MEFFPIAVFVYVLFVVCITKEATLFFRIASLCRQDVLEHLRLVAWLVVLDRTLTTWTSWASVVTAWAAVVVTTWTTVVTTVVLAAWASVSAWLALRLNITLRLLDEGLA